METDTVTFSTGLDGLSISPGEVIQTSDPVRSGDRLGGRFQAATASAFTLDSSVTIDGASTYTLWAVMPDGSVESSTVTTGAGATTTLTVSPAFSDTPELQSIWVLASTSVNPETWRVISISEDGVNASVTALEYRADKYAAIENNIKLDPIPISNLRAIPNKPSDIEIEEELYLITGSVVGARMTVSFAGDRGARYEIKYRRENGNFVTVNTSTASVNLEPVVAGAYEIRITAISSIGLRSQTAVASKIIYGLTLIPNNVTNFEVQGAITGSIFFTWDRSTDLDVIVGGYIRIRHTPNKSTPTWSNSVDIAGQVPGSSTSVSLPLVEGSYLAKWIDSSGNQSPDAVIITTDAPSVIALNFIEQLTETGFSGTKTNTFVSSEGGLILESLNTIDEQTSLVDTWPLMSALGGIATTGNYIFEDAIDLGSVQTSRITTAISMAGFDADDLIDSRPFIDTWASFDGELVDDVEAIM